MSIANRIQTGLAAQLSHPRGRRGAVVGRMLNRGNRSIVTAAAGLVAAPGATVADIGFGGGVNDSAPSHYRSSQRADVEDDCERLDRRAGS